ncbi:MAG: arylsulfatase [Promethearchaeota archaeon]
MNGKEVFKGKIGRTVEESEPWWPTPKRLDDGSPNVVIILLDDTGFSHFGCYGSSIDTPNIDKLANGGLRYTNFHTTALCSPTRACLLTGRNHHTVGMRAVSNMSSGFPHLRGSISKHAATLGEILQEEGYITFMTGKWHLAPMEEASMGGPFDNWPLRRGFDRFYGFMQGETDQFYPELTYDNHPVNPPYGPEDGYHVSEDLVDRSMEFIRDLKSMRPGKPFFLYLSFGATHSPHQSPLEYRQKYRGKFDAGWDVTREEWYKRQLKMGVIPPGTDLAPRNKGVKAWDGLSENQKKFACRLQEAFAGFLDHTDHQIGRLISFLEEIEEKENTLIVLLSDNGASQEGGSAGLMEEMTHFNTMSEDVDAIQDRLEDIGGPNSHSNYPWGWAQVGNTPLKWYKGNTHGGGIRDPLIMHWPKRIKDKGGIRNQFHHVTDIVPTILELLEIKPAPSYKGYDQMPISGTSMVYTFDGPEEKTHKHTQYFEMFGHRGIVHDGWKAVTHHTKTKPFNMKEWELYHLDEDFSECHDLAAEKPEKLRELVDLWWAEAGRYDVLPLDNRTLELFVGSRSKPGSILANSHFVYYPPINHMPMDVSPLGISGGLPWIIDAEITRANDTDEGVLVALGTMNGGLTFYIKDSHLICDLNMLMDHHIVRSDITVPTGKSTVRAHFRRKGKRGTLILSINGKECGSILLPYFLFVLSSTGMDIGQDSLSPVTKDYEAPFKFSGVIHRVVIDLPKYTSRRKGRAEKLKEAEANHRVEMSRQ